MNKRRTPYPAEFRAQLVELVKAGRTPVGTRIIESTLFSRSWSQHASGIEG